MLRLFLLRHGQTDYNLRNIVQGGGVDSDLNTHGRAQANFFYDAWHRQEFHGVYSSNLRRTRQTLEPFTQKGHEILPVGEMNELNWGVIEGKEATDDVRTAFNNVNERWSQGDLQARMEGGESPLEAWARIERGLDMIWRMHPKGGNVLVCTHGRLLRILLAGSLGYGLHRMNLFPHENTGLNILRMNRHGRFAVERLNDLSHLSNT